MMLTAMTMRIMTSEKASLLTTTVVVVVVAEAVVAVVSQLMRMLLLMLVLLLLLLMLLSIYESYSFGNSLGLEQGMHTDTYEIQTSG